MTQLEGELDRADRTAARERSSLTLDSAQARVKAWLEKQPFYPSQEDSEPLLGVIEEIAELGKAFSDSGDLAPLESFVKLVESGGKLARAHLKARQGIRNGKDQHAEKAKDALGDMLVFAMGYCIHMGWNLSECLDMALAEIEARDWAKYPETGKPPTSDHLKNAGLPPIKPLVTGQDAVAAFVSDIKYFSEQSRKPPTNGSVSSKNDATSDPYSHKTTFHKDGSYTTKVSINEAPNSKEIREECDAIRDMLLQKNAAYGDAALNPVRVFSKASTKEQILVRLDDKLSRLARGSNAGEDVILDLIGYLVLLRIASK